MSKIDLDDDDVEMLLRWATGCENHNECGECEWCEWNDNNESACEQLWMKIYKLKRKE